MDSSGLFTIGDIIGGAGDEAVEKLIEAANANVELSAAENTITRALMKWGTKYAEAMADLWGEEGFVEGARMQIVGLGTKWGLGIVATADGVLMKTYYNGVHPDMDPHVFFPWMP
jgi:hypothetical protein